MTNPYINQGVSQEAAYIKNQTRKGWRHLHESAALGIKSVLQDELAETWAECQQDNWDGYGALPVSRDALRNMYKFLEALPLGCPRPTIGADPNGHLSVEWYRSPRYVLSVALTDDDFLHYAVLLGTSNHCGTETFYGEVPDSILHLVRKVYS